MHLFLLAAYLLAFGFFIISTLDRYCYSRPVRLISAILFVLLIIFRLIFPVGFLVDEFISLFAYAIFAGVQIYIWHKLKKINDRNNQ